MIGFTAEEVVALTKFEGGKVVYERPRDDAVLRGLENQGYLEIHHNKTRKFWSVLVTEKAKRALKTWKEEQRRIASEKYEAEALF